LKLAAIKIKIILPFYNIKNPNFILFYFILIDFLFQKLSMLPISFILFFNFLFTTKYLMTTKGLLLFIFLFFYHLSSQSQKNPIHRYYRPRRL